MQPRNKEVKFSVRMSQWRLNQLHFITLNLFAVHNVHVYCTVLYFHTYVLHCNWQQNLFLAFQAYRHAKLCPSGIERYSL